MNTLLHYIYYLSLTLVATTCFTGCKESPVERLETAARLANERPDSAYVLIRDIDYNDLDADSLRAKYILTRALTNIRVGRSLITDTLLNDAASYYFSVGDTANWVIASQLLSGYNYIKGDSESALHRLDEMTNLIMNPDLLWDIYIHLLEFSINSQDYSSAYNYADWLFKHTDVPEDKLKFTIAKGSAKYLQGDFVKALAVYDSIIDLDVAKRVKPEVSAEFYREYAEILDGAGHSREAIAIMDSLYRNGESINEVERVCQKVFLAQCYANAGNIAKTKELLDSINHDATQSVFEVYAYIGMLKAAIKFKESGQFPSEMMHKVTKALHRNYMLSQYDRQTALELVIKLNDDNYQLKLQRQHLWLLISIFSFVIVVGSLTVFLVLNRRKQRMIEAEDRAETLALMLKNAQQAESEKANTSDRDKLKAALLRQLDIFKTFAGTPTQQSRDALKRISNIGNNDGPIESIVDWSEFYAMIDSLFDGFYSKLLKRYPDTFNDKECQIIVLLKAGFSTKEICVLTEQSSATIYTRKSVIRKKLGTPQSGDFVPQIDEEIKGI